MIRPAFALRARQQPLEEAQIVLQRRCSRPRPASKLLGQAFLRGLFGLQQALGRVGDRQRLLALFAQLGHLDAQLAPVRPWQSRSSPAMSLPNSKAHSAKAAEKPNIKATTAQRNGHGRWLRTIMRGALIDSGDAAVSSAYATRSNRALPNRRTSRTFKRRQGFIGSAAQQRMSRQAPKARPLERPPRGPVQRAALADQRLLNCLRRRAPCRPTFLRSTSRASRVTKPARLRSGLSAAS